MRVVEVDGGFFVGAGAFDGSAVGFAPPCCLSSDEPEPLAPSASSVLPLPSVSSTSPSAPWGS
ncbi:hypothetical protein, partial [Streptomyces caniscabiei]|uniref:hypothetical protein n=1 Tax=Streptomyces caniscabiei TaxID=2746961 RepID=UPI0030105259